MGPKSENVGFSLVLPLLFEGSRLPRGDSEELQISEPDRLGGGRGRVYPPQTVRLARLQTFPGTPVALLDLLLAVVVHIFAFQPY